MEEDRLTCEGCGRELEPDARFCMACGHPVPPMNEAQWGSADTEILRRAFEARQQEEAGEPPARGQRAWITVYRADGAVLMSLDLPEERETRIGRGSDQDVRLPDLTVSRAHAAIEFREGRFTVRDVGSTNATLLNGEPIGGREVLFDGAEITIGTHILVFREA